MLAFRPSNLLKRDSKKQMFSSKICEIFKSTYFEKHLQTDASRRYRKFQGSLQTSKASTST